MLRLPPQQIRRPSFLTVFAAEAHPLPDIGELRPAARPERAAPATPRSRTSMDLPRQLSARSGLQRVQQRRAIVTQSSSQHTSTQAAYTYSSQLISKNRSSGCQVYFTLKRVSSMLDTITRVRVS